MENRKRLRGDRDHWVEGKSMEEIEELGDLRYVFPVAILSYYTTH
jgi:hypothetical protein